MLAAIDYIRDINKQTLLRLISQTPVTPNATGWLQQKHQYWNTLSLQLPFSYFEYKLQ